MIASNHPNKASIKFLSQSELIWSIKISYLQIGRKEVVGWWGSPDLYAPHEHDEVWLLYNIIQNNALQLK